MAIDPAYGNSSGYFRDPVSGEELSVDTPRVVPCSLETVSSPGHVQHVQMDRSF